METIDPTPFVEFLVNLVIPALFLALAPIFRRYINTQLSAIQNDDLRHYASLLVQNAEQTIKGVASGKKRKQFVVNALYAYAQRRGIKLDHNEASAMIEAAVFQINNMPPLVEVKSAPVAIPPTTHLN